MFGLFGREPARHRFDAVKIASEFGHFKALCVQSLELRLERFRGKRFELERLRNQQPLAGGCFVVELSTDSFDAYPLIGMAQVQHDQSARCVKQGVALL